MGKFPEARDNKKAWQQYEREETASNEMRGKELAKTGARYPVNSV